ncbi:MAG TPA: hypothetical protein VH538_08790 [Gaiellaceae bacterium]|jgi:hypothetical protein
MARSNAWSGWVGFAGLLMIVIGGLDFFEGLIAVIRGQYYVLTATQIIVFDVTTWGWIMMIWGVIVVLAGMGLLAGSGAARWFTIIVAALNIFVQLGFVGSSQYPLWALTVLALNVIVFFALTARWSEARAGIAA